MKKLNLDSPATKGDLRKLATKKELKLEMGRLGQRIGGVEEKVDRLEKKVGGAEERLRAEIKISAQGTKEEIKEEFDRKLTATEGRILEAIDDFALEEQKFTAPA